MSRSCSFKGDLSSLTEHLHEKLSVMPQTKASKKMNTWNLVTNVQKIDVPWTASPSTAHSMQQHFLFIISQAHTCFQYTSKRVQEIHRWHFIVFTLNTWSMRNKQNELQACACLQGLASLRRGGMALTIGM